MGATLSYGYRRPVVAVVEGPPHLLDPWPSQPRVKTAIAGLLAQGSAMTTDDLAGRLGLADKPERVQVRTALGTMARCGQVVRVPGPPGRTRLGSWRLAEVGR